MSKRYLTNTECLLASGEMERECSLYIEASEGDPDWMVYGVPRGGVPVAYMLHAGRVADDPRLASFIVDDIIDSGRTRDRYKAQFPNTPFLALVDYLEKPKQKGEWLMFPWERGEDQQDLSGEDIVIRLLEYIGEDPHREGLKDTPQRVLKAWKEWTSGYGKDPKDVLKCFGDGAEGYDQMVWMRDLPFYSHCEHHLAPFFGTATIAYIPNEVVLGASKLDRILDVYAKRLQIQERITTQIADALESLLQPKGVGVLLRARHLCMESRGICKQGQEMVISALRGEMLTDNKARQEFLAMARA